MISPDRALYFFTKFFLNRSDVVPVLYGNEIFPVYGYQNIKALLISHLTGRKVEFVRRSNPEKVLEGSLKVGTYAPSIVNTTKYVCVDFDGPGKTHKIALADSKAACISTYYIFKEQGIPCYIESSSSGTGYHLWVFFTEAISATLARALCFSLIPRGFTLNDGSIVDITSGRGVEVYPKGDRLLEDGVGTQVWLPWHNSSIGSKFLSLKGESLEEIFPQTIDTIGFVEVQKIVAKCGGIQDAFVKPVKEFKVSSEDNPVWKEWRKQVLANLDLNTIYGQYLVENAKEKDGWLSCRDPESKSGDMKPSAGVSTGSSNTERGVYHSFISGETLSVFDFIRKRKVVADTHLDACKYLAMMTGIEIPKEQSEAPFVPVVTTPEISQVIVNNRQLRDIIEQTWTAINGDNQVNPRVFIRGGLLSYLRKTEFPPTINIFDTSSFIGYLADIINWRISTGNGGFRETNPPGTVANTMLSWDHDIKTGLPHLENIVTTPIFSRECRLVSTKGYNPDAKVWYAPSEDMKNIGDIPLHPTPLEVSNAKALLMEEVLHDFPFCNAGDIAHCFAAFILPFVRQLIDGPTPLHLVEAPTPGTGKGKICNIISIVSTGTMVPAASIPGDEESMRKLITSQLIAAKPIIFFDNMGEKSKLDSAALAAVLTMTKWEDRILGLSKTINLNNNCLWLLTANNPALSMELARRTVRIRIDAKRDQPWKRKDFKHPEIVDWVFQNRAELVKAILILIQNWISQSCPRSKQRLGSFENWAAIVGGILEANEIKGFLSNLDEMYENADTDGGVWRAFVLEWAKTYGQKPVTSTDLLNLCDNHGLLIPIVGEIGARNRCLKLTDNLRTIKDRVITNFIVTHSTSGLYQLKSIVSEENKPVGVLV